MQPRTLFSTTLALLACPACAVDDDLEFRTTAGSGGGTSAGTVFNTHRIEDVAFSELAPLGEPQLSLTLDRIVLPDAEEAAAYTVDDGQLVVVDLDGDKRTGKALLASEWQFRQAGWLVRRTMRLDAFELVDGVPNYVFTHRADGPDEWVSNCPEGLDGPGRARLLAGFTLDVATGELTPEAGTSFIACSTGAVGKAADWGYYDAAVAEGDLELFELAIRVVRADYCYDGGSWTKTGLPLIVENVFGVDDPYAKELQALGKPAPVDATVEAVWGREGLLCAGQPRYEVEIASACPGQSIPACAPGTTLADYPEGLIMTRLP